MNGSRIEKEYRKCLRDTSLVSLKDYKFTGESPIVSVLCLCYNHEKYLKRCMEGFLKQKVNFNVEIIIHDDASTDSSAQIIQEYAKIYPFIKPVLQQTNQYSKGINIENSILSKLAHGKYIAICEADDYWTDPYKLATQVCLIEQHPNCHFVVHKTSNIYINGKQFGSIPRQPMKSGIYHREEIVPTLIEQYLYHTTSYMFEAEKYHQYCENLPQFAKEMTVGDYALQLYFSNLGDTIYLNKEMSAHVHNVPGSWTDKSHQQDFEASMKHTEMMNHCMALFDEYTNKHFHQNYINRVNKTEMHRLYHNKEYSKILDYKEYSKYLKRYDRRSYLSIKLMIKHPKIYKFLKRH